MAKGEPGIIIRVVKILRGERDPKYAEDEEDRLRRLDLLADMKYMNGWGKKPR